MGSQADGAMGARAPTLVTAAIGARLQPKAEDLLIWGSVLAVTL